MFGFRYGSWDPELLKKLSHFKQLLDLFNFLLLKSNGDPARAMEMLRQLQQRGYLDESIDLDAFEKQLNEREIVRSEMGKMELTDKGVQGLRQSSLERIFQNLQSGGQGGGHLTPYGGGNLSEALPERRDFQFGDDIEAIDFNASMWNAMRREGNTDVPLEESDLVVHDSEFATSCATVLLLDISHSMILYGEDRFTPAKQVALALTELIMTRYRKDTLDIVLFGDEAHPVPIKELPFTAVGPYHTNTKAGLQLARKLLERRKNPNKQIFMITDGKPTVIQIPGQGTYRNTFGLDEMIVNCTLDEAVVCRRKGIVITTFMVAQDPYLEQFISKLTEKNRGRAFFSSADQVGDFVLVDFLRNRKGRGR